jgi:hypothetical protein
MSNQDPEAPQAKLKLNLGFSRAQSIHNTSPDVERFERKDSVAPKFEKNPINDVSIYNDTSNSHNNY